ncbi:hypothetical protein ADL12_37640 [Streptomyces regalis]|uniref:Uncharacterized protein n=1 Tax=Streptomyces regalis TaxID=68262 RepID=A0A124G7Z6_9ACTN|nr:hypothetical protein ADL12_37640 [Streptomyces regalis]
MVSLFISSGAAVMAGGSFATAVATYRRGRPRVELQAMSGLPKEGLKVYPGMPAMAVRNQTHVQAVNRSSVAVQVESLKVEMVSWRNWKKRLRKLKSPGFREVDDLKLFAESSSAMPMKLEPYETGRWSFGRYFGREISSAPPGKGRMRVVAHLSDGTTACSNWLSFERMRADEAKLLSQFSIRDGLVGGPQDEQLTLFEE